MQFLVSFIIQKKKYIIYCSMFKYTIYIFALSTLSSRLALVSNHAIAVKLLLRAFVWGWTPNLNHQIANSLRVGWWHWQVDS